jgi:NADH-quinone oxidoreductase subunit M
MLYALFRILVLVVLLLPLASAALVPFTGRAARRVSLTVVLLHLGVTAAVLLAVLASQGERAKTLPSATDAGLVKFQPVFVPGDAAGDEGESHRTAWVLMNLADAHNPNRPGPRVEFFVGVDGLNVWLVALCSLMMLPAVLVSWESVKDRAPAFFGWLFLLQGAAVGAFLSFDVILFYAFFELTLIPAFFLIGNWGTGSARRDAARKFFLYTLAGSLLTLVGIVGIVVTNPGADGQVTFSIPDLMGNVQNRLSRAHLTAVATGDPAELQALQRTQAWLFAALVAGFLVKVPVWPFHTWLPAAYNEAPVGVTVLLSAVLAKLGTFGLVRLVLPLTPDAAVQYGLPVIGTLAAFGIIYGALCAFAQRDIKLMVAYSSLSHLGFLTLGVFAFNAEGLSGAVLHMVNHGVSTGALFALLAFLLDRYRTTDMNQYGGLMGRFPKFALLTFVLCLASIGLPGLNNFVSEMLMLAGLFDARNPFVHRNGLAVVAAVGILLSAWYVLTMLQKAFFNPLREPPTGRPDEPRDATGREVVAFGSLAAVCLLLGLFPQPVLDSLKPDVRTLTAIGDKARERAAVGAGGLSPIEVTPPKDGPAGRGAPKGNAPAGGPRPPD